MRKIMLLVLVNILFASVCVAFASELTVVSDIDNSTLLNENIKDSGSKTVARIEVESGLNGNHGDVETEDGLYVYDHLETENSASVKQERNNKTKTVDPGTVLSHGDKVYFDKPAYLRAMYNYTPYRGVTFVVDDGMGGCSDNVTVSKLKNSKDSATLKFREPSGFDAENYEFIGIMYVDMDAGLPVFQPGDCFTVGYDDLKEGMNYLRFSYLYESIVSTVVGNETTDNVTADNETADNETADNETADNETTNNVTVGNETTINETSDKVNSDNETTDNETSDKVNSDNETSDNETDGNETGTVNSEDYVARSIAMIASIDEGDNDTSVYDEAEKELESIPMPVTGAAIDFIALALFMICIVWFAGFMDDRK